jgi:hypothetical protein
VNFSGTFGTTPDACTNPFFWSVLAQIGRVDRYGSSALLWRQPSQLSVEPYGKAGEAKPASPLFYMRGFPLSHLPIELFEALHRFYLRRILWNLADLPQFRMS